MGYFILILVLILVSVGKILDVVIFFQKKKIKKLQDEISNQPMYHMVIYKNKTTKQEVQQLSNIGHKALSKTTNYQNN